MLERALNGAGYEVRAESDPEGVLDRIRAFSPSHVAGHQAPGRNGIDLSGDHRQGYHPGGHADLGRHAETAVKR